MNDEDISGATHNEAVEVLSNAGDRVKMVILREREEVDEGVTENGVEETVQEHTNEVGDAFQLNRSSCG